VLVVGKVVVGSVTASGGDRDLDQGVLAAGLLARLEEGGVVLLDGMVVSPLRCGLAGGEAPTARRVLDHFA
jgi:hypothetical protein